MLTHDNLTNTPTCSLTHTPSSIRLSGCRRTLMGSPRLSPIQLGTPSGSNRSLDSQLLPDCPASSRSRRSWAEKDQKSSFEPKNLLNLFDETLESEPWGGKRLVGCSSLCKGSICDLPMQHDRRGGKCCMCKWRNLCCEFWLVISFVHLWLLGLCGFSLSF